MSQRELAERLKVDQQDVSRMETTGEIDMKSLLALRSLGLDMNSFLSQGDEKGTLVRDQVLSTLDLFRNIYQAGIQEVNANRIDALESFIEHLRNERDRIDITGTSLQGLFRFPPFRPAIIEALKNPTTHVRILLTHPALGFIRAITEGRRRVDGVEAEISEAISEHYQELCVHAKDRVQLRVVLSPPTIMGVFLRGRRVALLNPYTCTSPAYSTTTFLVRDVGDSCMYRKYHHDHFEEAWSNDATSWRRLSLSLDELQNDPRAKAFADCAKSFRESFMLLAIQGELRPSSIA